MMTYINYLYPEDESNFNFVNEKVKQYIKDVLVTVVPNFSPDITSSAFGTGEIPKKGHISGSAFNSALKYSRYYFNENQTLIHFTSIESAISIISEGCIRLVSLNKSSDRSEILYLANEFTPNGLLNQKIMLPGEYLNISMCSYDESQRDNEMFDLWRFYGKEGNGIGLVFEFDYSNQDLWFLYHLSKVYYGDIFKENLISLKTDSEAWCLKNDFEIDDLYEILTPLFCFHKVGRYKTENEVRLIKRPLSVLDHSDINSKFTGYTVNELGELVIFEKLYFEGRMRSEMISSSTPSENLDLRLNRDVPKFRLKEVMIGPTINDKKRKSLKGSMEALNERNMYGFKVTDSNFTSDS